MRSKSSSIACASGSTTDTVMSSPANARIASADSQNVCAVRAECERFGMPLMVEPLVMLPGARGGYESDGHAGRLVIGKAGKKGGFHDDGLQGQAGNLVRDHGPVVAEISQELGHAIQLLSLQGLLDELQVGVLRSRNRLGVSAALVRAVHFHCQFFCTVSEVDTNVINKMITLRCVSYNT